MRIAGLAIGLGISIVCQSLVALNAYGQEAVTSKSASKQSLQKMAGTQGASLQVMEMRLREVEAKLANASATQQIQIDELNSALRRMGELAEAHKTALEKAIESLNKENEITLREQLMLGSLIVSLLAFVVSSYAQLKYKRADTALEFSERYHEAIKDKAENGVSQGARAACALSNVIVAFENVLKQPKKPEEGNPDDLYDYLYWSIQHQEFTSWRRGLLPHKTYQFWMARRILEHHPKFESGGLHGWEVQKSKFEGSHFYEFIDKILKCSDNAGRTDVLKATKELSVSSALECAGLVMWEFASCGVKARRLWCQSLFPDGLISKFCKLLSGQ